MTMEERSSGIDDGTLTISTGATITSSNNNSNSLKTKVCDLMTDASYPLPRNKRSFDVAFLVAPDEKLIRRQTEKLVNLQFCTNRLMTDALRQQQRIPISEDCSDDSREYEQSDRAPKNMTIKHFESLEASSKYKIRCTEELQTTPFVSSKRRLTPTSSGLSPETPPVLLPTVSSRIQKSFSSSDTLQRNLQSRNKVFAIDDNSNDRLIDPNISLSVLRNKNSCDSINCPERLQGDSRSAFTKVNLTAQRSQLLRVSPNSSSVNYDDVTSSPRSSISPDVITYQNSLSPPIGPQSTSPNVGHFDSKYTSSFPTKMPYPFLISPESQQTTLLDNLKLSQQLSVQPAAPKVPSPKIPVTSFRPELSSASVYSNIPYNPLSAVFPPIGDALARPRFLTAGLLPPSFAALALPAQNVCAKCNLSFRMTSDLVYHMRSHHKSETVGEAARRRREDKLRCPRFNLFASQSFTQ